MIKINRYKYFTILLFLAVLFIGATLRSPISSIGPLVPFFKEELGVSNSLVGLMNTLPLVAFGLFSPLIPKLSQKFGMERTLMYSMVILAIGMWLRGTGGASLLLIGTIIVGFAIAVGNVMAPGLIKSSFPQQMGFVTGMYSVTMNLVSALAAGLSVSIAVAPGMNWRIAMQIWLIVPIIAALVLVLRIPYLRSRKKKVFAEIDSEPKQSVWKSKLAWTITLFMGLQSFIPYSLFAWLPIMLTTKGFSESEAGWLVTVNQLGIIPVAFVAPIIAGRMKKQSSLALFGAGSFFVGLLGIAYLPNAAIVLYLILIGVGAGTTYSLAMMFFVLRTQDIEQSYQLSGMAQSIGYLLAAVGPVCLGMISDITGSWSVPLIVLMGVAVLIAIFGFISGQPLTVHQPAHQQND
ncbi:MFS transporter [Staphylococcus gallinarum]|uniref:CynX/NimT family MFS transporter n=1 Tax=Staphylococcus gallinarum TaxID=1293 RepID=UPI001E527D2B|nr:MFS transporter [Staphylococcus gallinarum]MCD8829422.1 MFS transporter [Staphylococcus gallinarum]MDN6413126.1 MFS transporter [Staphylococcus gallinarum]MEB6056347.1 MFS transporter [Staphylococcus gallinarum]